MIPDGYQVDHLCRHKWCVNPQHLEPVTPSANTWRGSDGRCSPDGSDRVCLRGHPGPFALRKKRKPGSVQIYCKVCGALEKQRRRERNKQLGRKEGWTRDTPATS